MSWIGWLFAAAGIFSFCGGLFDWDWFMNSRKAQSLSRLISRSGARIFYCALGIFITVLGVMAGIGYIDMNQ